MLHDSMGWLPLTRRRRRGIPETGGGRVALDGDELAAALRAVAAASPEAVGVSRRTEIVSANPALVALLGRAHESELVGRPFPSLMTPASRAAMLEQVARRAVGAPVPASYRAVFERPDGSTLPLELHTTTFYAGDVVYSLATFRPAGVGSADELYQAVFQANSAIKLLIDPATGTIVDANEAAVRFYGWPLPELRGRTITSINTLPPDEVRARMQQAGAGERSWFQFRHRTASGEVRDVEVHSGRVDVYGRPHLLSIVQDVTERVALESRLREAQRLEAVGLVAGSVAHDFANLHTILLACADSLDASLPAGSAGRARLADLLHAARRAGELTHRLVEAAGGAARTPGPAHDLHLALAHAQPLLQAAAGPTTRLELASAPGAWSSLEPDQLERLLVNLVVNARDAGATRVRVEVGGGAELVLTVSDDGAGMDATTRDRVFEPFFTTKPAGRGLGLGLPSVRSLVAQVGGAVTVESAPGQGTTFRVTLPRSAAVPGPVLLVDDEGEVRDVLAQTLALEGFEVHTCADAEQAAALPDEVLRRFGALVTDQRMPGRSGTELARLLCARRPGLRVVVISGDLPARDGAGLPAGWVFLRKPFSGRDLVRALRG
jgi:two-component system cell cycle sensor histidine kinase/response regulator CckA